jgi:signal transduction histidine kinase
MLLSALLSESRRTERALRDSKAKLFQAQEDERKRIARELHDDLGQQLVLAEFQLAEIKAEVSSAVTPLVNKLSKQLLEISTDIREISHGLYPSLLLKLGLTAALKRLSQEISSDQGFEIVFISTVNDAVPPQLAVTLYRVAQEALQNVAKHSRARHVQMELKRAGDGLTLRVSDDGIGFDLKQPAAAGLGLDSMRERLWGIGGTLQIDSAPKKGTDIRAFVSFAQADSESE